MSASTPLRGAAAAATVAAIIPFAAMALGGCYAQVNDVQRVGGVVDLSDRDPKAPTVTPDGAPSLAGIDRSHWPAQTFLVPQDAVVSAPAYSPLRRWTRASARQVGDSPGTIDAATVDPVDNELAEAILMPLATVYDLVAIIPRAICTRPWTATLNPRNPYERSTPRWRDPLPHTGTAATAEAAAEADRVLREQYGDSLLLNEIERRPPTQREAPRGQQT